MARLRIPEGRRGPPRNRIARRLALLYLPPHSQCEGGSRMGGALDGIRVVEMGVWVAGPSCAAVLRDWGADVIKIEPPNGDPFRGLFASALGAPGAPNPPFEVDNRGKRSV